MRTHVRLWAALFVTTLALSVGALLMPARAAQTSPCGATVRVVSGDTLSRIAQRCGTTVAALRAANPTIQGDTIFVGQVLNIVPAGPGTPPDPRAFEQPLVAVYPLSGPPGTQVLLVGNGFPGGTEVLVSVGPRDGTLTDRFITTSDPDGSLDGALIIPADVQPGAVLSVVVQAVNGSARATSYAFVVTDGGTPPVIFTPTPAPTLAAPPTPAGATFNSVTIFLVAQDSGGSVGCGDSLQPVQVPVSPPTSAPLSTALQALLARPAEDASGLVNTVGKSSLIVQSISITNRAATIALVGQLRVDGACDVPRIQEQLAAVATQYDTIDSVTYTINGTPLDAALSAR